MKRWGGGKRTYIIATMRGNIKRIPIEDIYYFKADPKYVTVRHKNGESLIEESLVSLEPDLSDDFMRIHRNALVAKQSISELVGSWKEGVMVQINETDEELSVSRGNIANVRRFIKAKAD